MVHLAGGAAHWGSRGHLAGLDKFDRFEDAILPHLDAAYNLARWLMRDDHEAQDAVQDAYLRALRFFSGFRGGDGRVWLLSIVRNTCFSRIRSGRARKGDSEFDEQMHATDDSAANPETLLLRSQDEASLRRALESLPKEFREVIVMRELEGLSYKEIADVAELPIGTVMSRLARARKRLAQLLTGEGSGMRRLHCCLARNSRDAIRAAIGRRCLRCAGGIACEDSRRDRRRAPCGGRRVTKVILAAGRAFALAFAMGGRCARCRRRPHDYRARRRPAPICVFN